VSSVRTAAAGARPVPPVRIAEERFLLPEVRPQFELMRERVREHAAVTRARHGGQIIGRGRAHRTRITEDCSGERGPVA
jgi:hypothetical protein